MAIRARHETAMRAGASALRDAQNDARVGDGDGPIAAEDIHRAVRALDSLVGRIDVETVLGEIFASFCLGK